MMILGIDPGTARIGWSIVEEKNNTPIIHAYGLITTEKTDTAPVRLSILFDAITTIVKKYKPTMMSIEDLFFATNAKTAIAVGEARGVILLAATKQNIPVVSYTPLAVKRTITGDGHADKKQVQRMVTQLLKLKEVPKPDDVADAIALALTHVYTKKFIK